MFNKLVGNAKTGHLALVLVIGHKFQYSTSHAALYAAVFNRNHMLVPTEYIMQQCLIQWFNKAQVVMCRVYALAIEFLAGLYSKITNVPNSQDGYIFPITDLPALAHFYGSQRSFPVRHHPVAARIPDREWPHISLLRGVHHIAQLLFVHWRSHGHVWDT